MKMLGVIYFTLFYFRLNKWNIWNNKFNNRSNKKAIMTKIIKRKRKIKKMLKKVLINTLICNLIKNKWKKSLIQIKYYFWKIRKSKNNKIKS